MKIRNMILAAASALASVSVTSCDNNDGMDSSLSIYQQYEVLVENGEAAAFANFREGTAAGQRLELTDGSWLMINALTTYYQKPISADEPEFNYSIMIPENHTKVNFVFHRSKDVELVNSVEMSEATVIKLPSNLDNITNGNILTLDYKGINPSEIDVYLVSEGTVSETYHSATFADGVIFTGVPAGKYTLVADAVKVLPTQQNDGSAKGSITLIGRSTLSHVNVN